MAGNPHRQAKALFGWQNTLTGKTIIWLAIHTDRQKALFRWQYTLTGKKHDSAGNTH